MTLVRGFIGRAGQEAVLDRSDEGLVDILRGELSTVLSIFLWPSKSCTARRLPVRL